MERYDKNNICCSNNRLYRDHYLRDNPFPSRWKFLNQLEY